MAKYYAVRKGKKTGIFTNWDETKAQVSGYPGAQYKSFKAKADAEAYLKDEEEKPSSDFKKGKTPLVHWTNEVVVYTDGGSRNTGNVQGGHVKASDKAAWAYRIEVDDTVIPGSGGEFGATNNRMEIMALREALRKLISLNLTDREILIVMDSTYVLNAINKGWMTGWKRNGWKRSSGKLLNKELWQELDRLLPQFSKLRYEWTKGHATNDGNIFVDELLNQTMDEMPDKGAKQPHVSHKPTKAHLTKPEVSAPALKKEPVIKKAEPTVADKAATERSVNDIAESLKKLGF